MAFVIVVAVTCLYVLKGKKWLKWYAKHLVYNLLFYYRRILWVCAHKQNLKNYIQHFKGFKDSWEVKFWRVSLRRGRFILQFLYFGVL